MSTQQKIGEFETIEESQEPRRDYTDTGGEYISETVGRQYIDEGVKILNENTAGGKWSCSWTIVEWGTAEDIKQCPGCGEFHSAADPELCHSCAFNL